MPAYYSIFELIISRNPPPVTVTQPPEFVEDIVELFSFHYSTTLFEYVLPETIDYEANVIYIEISNLPTWLVWKEEETKFEFAPQGITKADVGTYMISVTLTDSSGARSDPYTITIIIEDDPEPEEDFSVDF